MAGCWISYITCTLRNKTERYRGFEDMKDEISGSLKVSDIFGLIFLLNVLLLG